MDNVLVDFPSAFSHVPNDVLEKYADNKDDIPGIFSLMQPFDGAIDAYEKLSQKYDTYILSTAPWDNPSAWSDKIIWVQKYLGNSAHKRLILSHNKNLNLGDYLINFKKFKFDLGCSIQKDNFNQILLPQIIIKDAMIVY